ncbi:MAG: hypothetical protein KIT83_03535 [Bryobacterales bacterium]|nr:hypothetical protein [Bryobacterales bacterium]
MHRHWFVESGMDALRGENFRVAVNDRLYRCLDRILEHKSELFVWRRPKRAELFAADFAVLLYDLTSIYLEGGLEENPKARRGDSRDHRPGCVQVVIARVVTPDGRWLVLPRYTQPARELHVLLDKIHRALPSQPAPRITASAAAQSAQTQPGGGEDIRPSALCSRASKKRYEKGRPPACKSQEERPIVFSCLFRSS